MFILIPTMVLSGFIFPIESMPAEIVPLTYFIPLRYALVVLRGAFLKGSGVWTGRPHAGDGGVLGGDIRSGGVALQQAPGGLTPRASQGRNGAVS